MRLTFPEAVFMDIKIIGADEENMKIRYVVQGNQDNEKRTLM